MILLCSVLLHKHSCSSFYSKFCPLVDFTSQLHSTLSFIGLSSFVSPALPHFYVPVAPILICLFFNGLHFFTFLIIDSDALIFTPKLSYMLVLLYTLLYSLQPTALLLLDFSSTCSSSVILLESFFPIPNQIQSKFKELRTQCFGNWHLWLFITII